MCFFKTIGIWCVLSDLAFWGPPTLLLPGNEILLPSMTNDGYQASLAIESSVSRLTAVGTELVDRLCEVNGPERCDDCWKGQKDVEEVVVFVLHQYVSAIFSLFCSWSLDSFLVLCSFAAPPSLHHLQENWELWERGWKHDDKRMR